MKFSIGEASKFLNVSPQTLRRWGDESGGKKAILKPEPRVGASHRYYSEDAIEDLLACNFKYLFDLGKRWSFDQGGFEMIPRLYCRDRSIFKARLTKLETSLMGDASLGDRYSLISSVVGEIGNNSFDHNLGNWPDIPGIFFGYNSEKKKIIIADRGQGILTTLKRVKPELRNDEEALKTAFTEVISGRSPESRGNGLKYVRMIAEGGNMDLLFQSGSACVEISDRTKSLRITKVDTELRGCFALIEY